MRRSSVSPERPSWDSYFVSLAQAASSRSTCSRLQVGAVRVSQIGNEVLGTGYNGSPSGMEHCEHEYIIDGDYAGTYGPEGCEISIHAEVNALLHGVRPSWGSETLYCTHAPCFRCSLLVLNSRVTRVVYGETYRSDRGIVLLENQGLEVERYG